MIVLLRCRNFPPPSCSIRITCFVRALHSFIMRIVVRLRIQSGVRAISRTHWWIGKEKEFRRLVLPRAYRRVYRSSTVNRVNLSHERGVQIRRAFVPWYHCPFFSLSPFFYPERPPGTSLHRLRAGGRMQWRIDRPEVNRGHQSS